MYLSGTVSMLETTSGFGEIESTETPRPFSSQTVPHRFTFTSTWKVVLTSDSHFRPNRKWKFGGNHTVELATMDFLFDLNTMYGSIGHRFDAGNYFRFRRNRKY